METMQAVIIFGVAAVVLTGLYTLKDKILDFVKEALKDMGFTVD